MSVNKFTIRQDAIVDKQINIPVELKWDYLGLDMAIDEYETKAIEDVIGKGRDFEVSRFSHAPATGTTDNTAVNYEFYFYSGGSLNDINNWRINYLSEGFTPQEVYYYNNNFANSFFKLDFYDTPDEKQQTNYITIILPTQQGLFMETQMQRTLVNIRKPQFVLDYVGDKEGFFIYWLKKRNFLYISTFYMTAKFFDGKTGQFVRMMNRPQSTIQGNKFVFSSSDYFYYRVDMDYLTHSYKVYDIINPNDRVGGTVPIKWYEYINP
jgi:hypothetical protein